MDEKDMINSNESNIEAHMTVSENSEYHWNLQKCIFKSIFKKEVP